MNAVSAADGGGDAKTIEEMITNATHPLLKTPDWGANIAIVDAISQYRNNSEFALRVLKALRPRVTNSDPKIGLLGLALLESIVKNCPSFHPLVANRDFLKEIIKTVPKKVRDPQSKSLFRLDSHSDAASLERTDRVLIVIQSWAKAFAGSKGYPAFAEVYQDLIGRGVKFPEPSVDEVAPVWTPPVHIPNEQQKPKPKPSPGALAIAKANGGLTDPNCRACMSSVELLESLLNASAPTDDLKRHEIIPELVKGMRVAQNELLSRLTAGTASEALTVELLTVNDAMLSAIRYYEGLCAGTMQRKKSAPAASAAASTPVRDDPKKEDSKPRSEGKQSSPPAASAAAAYAAAAASGSPFNEPAPAGGGAYGQSSPVPKKIVPVLAPPSSNTKTKGRHGSSPVAITAAAAPANSALPIINLQAQSAAAVAATGSTPPKTGAGTGKAAGEIDLSDFFFGSAAPTAAPAPAHVSVQVPSVPPQQQQTANGARAASVLDQFLGVQSRSVATPAPPQPVNPFAAPSVPVPNVNRPILQSIAPPPQRLVAANNTTALDDDPFAAFAARDAPAAAAPVQSGGGAAAAAFEENPFDQLANRGL